MTASIIYEGHLRTTCTHIESDTRILTDAPKDNQGNGESFSPTDLVATALGSCIITTMGIKSHQMGISINGAKAEVTKVMASEPRRIARVEIVIYMPPLTYSDKDKQILEHTAKHCPVAVSLHPDLVQDIVFHW